MANINNSGGKIMYGMHFYPGLAQYDSVDKESFKIFLNEDVLRKMDPTFAGKPIFVDHVEEVAPNIDQVKKDADGWVVESFFNEADGKHWVKMVIVSEKGERAIKNGFRLSNAYVPKLNGRAGIWNGISYQDEVIAGEYEHLAIVQNPRYDESVIMTPEQFKAYNENLKIELTKIANSKETNCMKLKFWNRKPVENSVDIESISVTLPKSGLEYSISQIVNAMDEMEMEKKKKKENKEAATETGLETKKVPLDVEGDLHNEDDEEDEKKKKKSKLEMDDCMNEDEEREEEDKKAKKKALELAAHEDKEMKNKKMKNENFLKLKNAPENAQRFDNSHVEIGEDKVARGKSRYGSN